MQKLLADFAALNRVFLVNVPFDKKATSFRVSAYLSHPFR